MPIKHQKYKCVTVTCYISFASIIFMEMNRESSWGFQNANINNNQFSFYYDVFSKLYQKIFNAMKYIFYKCQGSANFYGLYKDVCIYLHITFIERTLYSRPYKYAHYGDTCTIGLRKYGFVIARLQATTFIAQMLCNRIVRSSTVKNI